MKILFQEICCRKLHWDEVLTEELKGRWDKWIEDLLRTKKVVVGRCLYEMKDESERMLSAWIW